MTYNKPDVTVLGPAVEVIQMQVKPGTHGTDNVIYAHVPAYDLDE
jgi:hypothetical protein